MALIGKIREKSWLLLIVVGIAMLAFILPWDKLLGNSAPVDDIGMGTIDGTKVDQKLYTGFVNRAQQNTFQQKLSQFEQQNGRQPATQEEYDQLQLTEQDVKNAKRQAWSATVQNSLITKEFEKLGLVVTEDEIDDMIYARNGYPVLQQFQSFVNPISNELDADSLEIAIQQTIDASPEGAQQITDMRTGLREQAMFNKYQTLVSRGIQVTSLEAQNAFANEKETKSITYVAKKFQDVSDDDISYTEDELLAYYEKHKTEKKYEAKESRKLNYFDIQILPSAADSAKAKEFSNEKKSLFAAAANDSMFVLKNSSDRSYRVATVKMGAEGADMDELIANGVVGEAYGPYLGYSATNQPAYRTIKVVGKMTTPDSASVRHILFSTQGKPQAEVFQIRAKADSIMGAIKAGSNFGDLAAQFSEDPGSKDKGGVYEFFPRGRMVPPFENFAFEQSIGSIGVVTTSYGFHIVEVLKQKGATPAMKYVALAKNIVTSIDTENEVNEKATELLYLIDSKMDGKSDEEKIAAFDTIAKQNGYVVRNAVVFAENASVPGFSPSVENKLIRLAYEDGVKIGSTSTSTIKDGARYVIAMVSQVNASGVPTYANIKSRMETDLKKEKKGEFLVNKMVNKDIQTIAAEMGVQVENAEVTFAKPTIGTGQEPSVVGTIFSGVKKGERTVPVVGKSAVYVVRVDNTTAPEATSDYTVQKDKLRQTMRQTMSNSYGQGLVNSVEVVDNRKFREIGVR